MEFVVNPDMTPNYLDRNGLHAFYDQNLINILKRNNYMVENAQQGQMINLPIGITGDKDFKYVNRLKHSIPKRHKIQKNMEKTFELYEPQRKVMSVITENMNKSLKDKTPGYFCVQADCGFGKTLLAIQTISKYPYNMTFIITHNKFAATQFAQRLRAALPHIDVYVSVNGVLSFLQKTKTEGYVKPDVLIFPARHVSNIEFRNYLLDNFTLGIADEVHVNNFMNDSSIRDFFLHTAFYAMLSMTATPRLNNQIYMGKPIIVSEIVKIDYPFRRNAIAVVSDKYIENFDRTSSYKLFATAPTATLKHVRKLQCIAEDVNRRALITSHILLHYQTLNARIIVLVEFKEEAFYYSENLKSKGIESFMRIDNQEVHDAVNEYTKDKLKYVVIGTVDKLGTGFDLPSCNTVFVTSLYNTKTDVQQYAGRCIRTYAPDNLAERTFYYFIMSPCSRIPLRAFYKNMTTALKEIGWTCTTRTIYESLT